MTSRRDRILVVATVLVVCGLLAGLLTLRTTGAASDLREAQDLLERAAESLEEGELVQARAALAAAEELIVTANEALRAPDVGVLGTLPGLNVNMRALEQSLELAAAVVHGGVNVLEEAEPLQGPDGKLEVSLSDGSVPLEAITRSRVEIEALLGDLLQREPPPDSPLLLGAVQELRDSVVERAQERVRQLDVLNRGLALLEEMIGANGPRRYLIAVANTAEMRGSGGMILNYGVLEGRDGTATLPEFGRIDELALSTPVSASSAPDDYLARWDGFDPLLRWRQANLAADFTVVAPVLETMYEQVTRLSADGVIQVDPHGLAALLAGVGPVTVPELGVVNAANVVDLTLHEAYVRFPGVEERSDVLGDVAEAAFRRLVEGEIPSLRTLATALVDAVDGRHLIVHSTNSALQRQSWSFGADGALPDAEGPDSFSLTAQNLSGNKLDYFLDTSLDLSGQRPSGAIGEIEAVIALENVATPGVVAPSYIYGRGGEGNTAPGTIRTLVTLYLPFGTSLAGSDGDPTIEPVVTGTEDGRPYASFTFDVPAGERRQIALSLRLAPRPDGDYPLVLVPSPRVRPTQVSVDIDLGSGVIDGDVALDRSLRFTVGRDPEPIVAPVFADPQRTRP